MPIREVLQRLMDEQDENPHSLSIKSKVPQPTIFRILQGTSVDPRRSTVEKLARALGVDAECFYSGAPNRVHLVAQQPEAEYCAEPVQQNEERLLRALRLASPDQRAMLLHLADKILEDAADFDERAGTQ